MCGICGYIHLDNTKSASAYIVKAMSDTLVHRGPDDSGVFIKGNIGLGHRRLSIIDLKTGHQPMSNEDSSVVIVYNGEVYNFREIREILEKRGHRFQTYSDTEVILHAYEEYGEDCLNGFNGMFAFAIWDMKKEKLFLARDRFGKKPLYYAVFDNQFLFASEIKAILKHPSVKKEIDPGALGKYLAYEYVPSPHTIFKKIKKLEPGHKLSLKGTTIDVGKYWDINFRHRKSYDLEDVQNELEKLLKESVRKRLVSDVPLGVFLSGGMDSSSVVSMMADLMVPKDIKTFSIGFRERSYDESSDARRIADYFGTDHHEEILKPDTMLEVLPKVLDILDEPFADSSIIPAYLVSKFTRRYVTVALGGDGGDELFLGYPSFFAYKLDRIFEALPASLRKTLEAAAGAIPVSQEYMSLGFKARRFFRGLSFPEEVRHQAWIGCFTPPEEKLLLEGSGLGHDASDIYDTTNRLFQNVREADPLSRASYIYLKTYMTDDILAKVDRASMANSLEVRAPFLDTEFAEFAASLPSDFKLRGLTTKWILKRAMKKRLPPQTLKKSKQGFGVPVAKWLREDLKGILLDALDEKRIKREGIFNSSYIKDLLSQYMANRKDVRKEIWALFMFQMWLERWMK